ncbi:MAG: hypothetical protein IMZ66_04210 [Planctomycetes bacterium]|nr:hypothetical protein [Planctomycetota bacterium]
MDDPFTRKVRAAAGAAWGVVVVGVVWMSVAYFAWLAILHCRPPWLMALWGGEGSIDWGDYQLLGIGFFAITKTGLFALVLAALWLTLWARRLARAG